MRRSRRRSRLLRRTFQQTSRNCSRLIRQSSSRFENNRRGSIYNAFTLSMLNATRINITVLIRWTEKWIRRATHKANIRTSGVARRLQIPPPCCTPSSSSLFSLEHPPRFPPSQFLPRFHSLHSSPSMHIPPPLPPPPVCLSPVPSLFSLDLLRTSSRTPGALLSCSLNP